MARKRPRHRRMQAEVELNITSMLDMAFQLLAFFILTFRPSAVEGHLLLHMPPAVPVTDVQPLSDANPVEGELKDAQKTLDIAILSDANGGISSLRLGAGVVFNGPASAANLSLLDQRLRLLFSEKTSQYDRVLIRSAKNLQYGELMRVVDVCTRQKLADGQLLRTINFVPLVDAEPGG